jgi:hypothetical protein
MVGRTEVPASINKRAGGVFLGHSLEAPEKHQR